MARTANPKGDGARWKVLVQQVQFWSNSRVFVRHVGSRIERREGEVKHRALAAQLPGNIRCAL